MNKQRILRIVAFVMALSLLLSVVATAFAYSTIPYGEQSDAVRKLQTALKKKYYYSGSVDGKFGPATKRAVMKYQKSIGLRADGKPGNKTLSALYDGVESINKTSNTDRKNQTKPKNPRALYYGCTGSRVRQLQRSLKNVGCYNGALDGVYGDLTFDAVKKFQYKKKLHADGIAGTKTLNALNNSSAVKVGKEFVLAYGSTGSTVKKLQSYLRQIGLGYLMEGDNSGTFGRGTEEAVKAWQEGRGRSATGSVSESDYNDIVNRPASTDEE